MFTKEYFYEELHRFRKLMTNAADLLDTEKMDRAVSGLSYIYFNVDCPADETETIAAFFDATIREYSFRSSMMKINS